MMISFSERLDAEYKHVSERAKLLGHPPFEDYHWVGDDDVTNILREAWGSMRLRGIVALSAMLFALAPRPDNAEAPTQASARAMTDQPAEIVARLVCAAYRMGRKDAEVEQLRSMAGGV